MLYFGGEADTLPFLFGEVGFVELNSHFTEVIQVGMIFLLVLHLHLHHEKTECLSFG